MARIRIDWQKIPQQNGVKLNRVDAIQQRKNVTAHLRDHYLSEILNYPINEHSFARTEFGKPYLKSTPFCYFNHSHSQQHYALASSSKLRDIGVDIEDLDRSVKFEALAQHAFHQNELDEWEKSEYDREYWFKVWTTKEAVLKASGLGIRINLKELDTQVKVLANGGMCQHSKIGTYAYHNIQLPHAMLTVAWASESSCKGFNFPAIDVFSANG